MINFNELLANELGQYLFDNQDWFLKYDAYTGDITYLDKMALIEAIKGYSSLHEQPVPALLRKKE